MAASQHYQRHIPFNRFQRVGITSTRKDTCSPLFAVQLCSVNMNASSLMRSCWCSERNPSFLSTSTKHLSNTIPTSRIHTTKTYAQTTWKGFWLIMKRVQIQHFISGMREPLIHSPTNPFQREHTKHTHTQKPGVIRAIWTTYPHLTVRTAFTQKHTFICDIYKHLQCREQHT